MDMVWIWIWIWIWISRLGHFEREMRDERDERGGLFIHLGKV